MKKIFILYTLIIGFSSLASAQCYPDRHNTTWFDAWISCDMAQNPNQARGTSHWIMYDLGRDYVISKMHFWNLNIPGRTHDGVRQMSIDVSDNGNDWTEVGIYEADSATASSIYEGVEIPDFGPTSGQYLLITILDTWGGNCAGFSEMRIEVEPKIISSTPQLEDMDCQPKKDGIRITWEQQSKDEEVFIEKSVDGMKWQNINHFIPNSASQGSYYWEDRETTQGYYRLKRKQSGAFAYSKVHYCTKSSLVASVWPNPVKGKCQLRIGSTSHAKIEYRVSNVYGQTIHSASIPAAGPLTYIDLNLLSLAQGTYIIDVQQDGETTSTRFVKL